MNRVHRKRELGKRKILRGIISAHELLLGVTVTPFSAMHDFCNAKNFAFTFAPRSRNHLLNHILTQLNSKG